MKTKISKIFLNGTKTSKIKTKNKGFFKNEFRQIVFVLLIKIIAMQTYQK